MFTLAKIGVALVLFVAGLLFDGIVSVVLFGVSFLVCGYEVIFEATKGLLAGELFDENFLMGVAGIAAFAIGEYPEAVMVMLLFTVGEYLEDIAVEKTRRSVQSLSALKPERVHRILDTSVEDVEPESISVGELFAVEPGERVPLDGVIVEGASSLDTAALTGESLPVDVTVGSSVLSGSVNLSGRIVVRATAVYGESTVSRILRLMEESGEKKSKAEKFISRFARIYTPVICVCAVLVACLPPLLLNGEWKEWLTRSLTFLVSSCPCALVISVPLAFFSGIGLASRRGILVKDSVSLERLAHATTAVFDKTGTLTEGKFEVTEIHSHLGDEETLIELAAHAEAHSPHPIAESVVRAGGEIDESRIDEIRELPGLGAIATVDGSEIAVGNEKLMEDRGAAVCHCHHHEGTTVHLAKDGAYIGHIMIRDKIKDNAAKALSMLRREGVERIVMLSGDREASAREIADALGISEVKSNLLPEGKTAAMEELLSEKKKRDCVIYAGDGMNDAPVLRISDVGIAMGALGSSAAVESADAVICDDDPEKVALAVKIGRRTSRVARDNVVFALVLKLSVMILGVLGYSPMWLAVAADVGVTVCCVLMSALRLRE